MRKARDQDKAAAKEDPGIFNKLLQKQKKYCKKVHKKILPINKKKWLNLQ